MRKAIIEGHQRKLVELSPTAARAVEKLALSASGLRQTAKRRTLRAGLADVREE